MLARRAYMINTGRDRLAATGAYAALYVIDTVTSEQNWQCADRALHVETDRCKNLVAPVRQHVGRRCDSCVRTPDHRRSRKANSLQPEAGRVSG